MDLGEGERTGKPTGVDIKERKMTLPLIHTLQQADSSKRRRIIRLVKYRSNDPKAVAEVMTTVLEGPGMAYARKRMDELLEEAMEMLQAFELSPSREALRDLVQYTIQRKK